MDDYEWEKLQSKKSFKELLCMWYQYWPAPDQMPDMNLLPCVEGVPRFTQWIYSNFGEETEAAMVWTNLDLMATVIIFNPDKHIRALKAPKGVNLEKDYQVDLLVFDDRKAGLEWIKDYAEKRADLQRLPVYLDDETPSKEIPYPELPSKPPQASRRETYSSNDWKKICHFIRWHRFADEGTPPLSD